MSKMANLISTTAGRVCLVADVRKKINSLRFQYLAEKLKITKCTSGSGGDYIPTVYWFPLLRFMDISTEADASLLSQTWIANYLKLSRTHSSYMMRQHTHKTKKKKLSTQDGDTDGLIKEATATMRQMSQHITSNTQTNSVNHITTFCNFVNSELTSILQASNINFVKKAKRKEIWDEIDTGNLNEESPSTLATYSESSKMSWNTQTSKSVVTVTPGSLVIKRKDLLTKQDKENVEIYTEDENNIPVPTPSNIKKSKEQIVYYKNMYPEELVLMDH